MTDEQREEIKRLAVAASLAEQKVHWAGYQNRPHEADKAAEQSARYALLQAEAYVARGALEDAIKALGRPAEPWVRELASELLKAARTPA